MPHRPDGDDRILLSTRAGGPPTGAGAPVARPHPRIAGFIERRGLGIVASPHVDAAPVAGIVELDPPSGAVSVREAAGLDLPRLAIARVDDPREAAARVLRWWDGSPSATQKA